MTPCPAAREAGHYLLAAPSPDGTVALTPSSTKRETIAGDRGARRHARRKGLAVIVADAVLLIIVVGIGALEAGALMFSRGDAGVGLGH